MIRDEADLHPEVSRESWRKDTEGRHAQNYLLEEQSGCQSGECIGRPEELLFFKCPDNIKSIDLMQSLLNSNGTFHQNKTKTILKFV